jgi:predicted GNAT family acetyltransferase
VASETVVTVRDNAVASRYELLLDGTRAGDLYYLARPDAVVLVHTEVAPELEGRGLAGRLISGALEDIRARGLRVIPVCPFASSYLRRHPEHADLLERSAEPSREGG